MATINNINRRKLSGTGVAEIHAKYFLDQLDALINEVNGRKFFFSDEIVAEGAEQEVEHNLGSIPTIVRVLGVTHVPDTGYGEGSGLPYTITLGEHDATTLRFTATSGIKLTLMAVKAPE